MSKKIIISCENIQLNLPVKTSRPSYALKDFASSITGGNLKKDKSQTYIQALSNLNLEIKEGERIALIGPNGAGKTTLIRLLSGIFSPSSGKLTCKQYAMPLIDKSFFIDLDLSGYDACKAQFLRYAPKNMLFSDFIRSIEKFSELGDFLSTPISTYSAGMKTRLMFALITSFSHPILAMDEGIATGDRFFIEKAIKRFETFLASSSTLILASHDEKLLKRFTNRGLVLQKGTCIFDGKLEEALEFYSNLRGQL